ncbi:MAG: hypothetical protein KDJ99_02875, partial [Candidatus Competibacteraceae bacterium]|nr:hypothetical protein [Candidatus Competibacteraceae bacterium]
MGDITADADPDSADATLLFEFFVPKQDNIPGEVLPTDSGDDKISPNQAYAEGSWDPIDADDSEEIARAEITDLGDAGGPEHELEDQAIAIQKSVGVVGGGEPRPGAILQYTLTFQVSDYFAFDDVFISDVLSDGQRLCANTASSVNVVACSDGSIPDFTPTLVYTEAG